MSDFSKRHYEVVARLIREARKDADDGEQSGIWRLTVQLADFFKLDSPRFDRPRFLRAATSGEDMLDGSEPGAPDALDTGEEVTL